MERIPPTTAGETPSEGFSGYKPDTSIVRWLRLLFRIYIVASGVLLLCESLTAAFFPDLLIKEIYESGMEMAVSLLAALSALVTTVAFLVIVVLYCIWVRGANRNARALGAREMQFTPGWCIGYFFLPILNLFRPYQAVREVYRASGPDNERSAWADSPVPEWLGLWWMLWLVSSFVGNIEMRMSFSEDPDTLAASMYVAPVASVLNIGAAILAVRVVLAIHGRQTDKWQAQVFA